MRVASSPNLLEDLSQLDPLLATESWQTLMTLVKESVRTYLNFVYFQYCSISSLMTSCKANSHGTDILAHGRRYPSGNLWSDRRGRSWSRKSEEPQSVSSLYFWEWTRWERLRDLRITAVDLHINRSKSWSWQNLYSALRTCVSIILKPRVLHQEHKQS